MDLKLPAENRRKSDFRLECDVTIDSGRCSADSSGGGGSGDVIDPTTSKIRTPDPDDDERDSGVTSLSKHDDDVSNLDDDESDDVTEDLELDECAVLFNLEAGRRASMTEDDVTTAPWMESPLEQNELRHIRCTAAAGPGRKSSLPINIVADRKDLLLKKRAQSSPNPCDVICNQQNSSERSILTKMRELSRHAYHDSTLIFGEKPGRATTTTHNKFQPS